MYSQGSYNPQSGQGSQTTITPPYLQSPLAPPPVAHNFQQGPLPPPPPKVPLRPGQPGPPVYQHGPLAPHLAVQQLPPGGIPNPGQSYLRPPPTVHGSGPVPHMYTTAQQNLQHPSYLAPGPPPPPPPPPFGSHRPEMLQAPLPLRGFHPPPSQGQTLYRAPVHQLPQQPGGVQGLQHIPPPPPPSCFSTSTPSGSSAESTVGNSQISSMAPLPPPPPPPPLPPPLPPSSPPPIPSSQSLSKSPMMSLSTPVHTGSSWPSHSHSDPNSSEVSGHKLGTSGTVVEVIHVNQGRNNIPTHDSNLYVEDGSGREARYLDGHGSSSRRSLILDVPPPPPPKPAEGKIVQKLEELCQLIAKNGSSYEDVIRQNESGNPDFKFLFGGEPGSEAAIAYEYFLWLKKHCALASKLDEGKTYSSTQPLGIESSMQPNQLLVAAGSRSPADSDMEMEDDITQSDNDHAVNYPLEGPPHTHDLIGSEFNVKEQIHPPQHLAESDAAMVVLSEKVSLSGSSGMGEQGSKLVSTHDHLTSGRSVSEVHTPVISSAGAAESPLTSNTENSTTPLANDNVLAAAECFNSDKSSGQIIKGGSPFRLLQGYASGDSSENDEGPSLKDAIPRTVTPLVAVGAENLHNDTGVNLETDTESKSHYKTEKGFELLSESKFSYRVHVSDSQREINETFPRSVTIRSTTEHIVSKNENQASISYAASPKTFPKEDAYGGAWVNVAISGKHQKDEDKSANFASSAQKIDKFGRLVREGVSDSDSDGSRYAVRRNRRRKSRSRSRSRSQSRSPLDRRRRRRRSPRRRRQKRSRSRSWSPRNRRSQSKSPSFRHAGDFSGGYVRRDKGQMPDCFDFLRGRCYRGASCRYLHHDSQKSDGSRHHRSKQHYPQPPPGSKNSGTHEEMKKISQKVSDLEQEIMGQEMQLSHDMPGGSVGAAKNVKIDYNKENSVSDALQRVIADEDTVGFDIIKSDFSREVAAKLPETKVVQDEPEDCTTHVDENVQGAVESDRPLVVDSFPSITVGDADILRSHDEASHSLRSLKDSAIQHSQSDLSDPVLEDAHPPPQQTTDSSMSDSSPDKTSTTSQKKLPANETVSNITDFADNPSQIVPLLPPASLSEVVNVPCMKQLARDSSLIPQTAAFQSQSAPLEGFPPYMLPNQNSLFSGPPNSSWASLPLPRLLLPPYDSTVNTGAAPPSTSLQFQQNHLLSRNDFGSQMVLRPYSTELPGHSHAAEFQHRAHSPVQEPHRPPLHVEDFRKPLPGCNPSNQQFGGPSVFREDCLTQLPMQGLSTSNCSTQRKTYPQPMTSTQESPASKIRSFPGDSLTPGEILTSSSQIYPYAQHQQPPYGLHHSVPDSVYGLSGKISSSRYPPDVLDTNQPSCVPDFGVLRSSTHYNPYASTFEQPLSSRFSSDVFRQEKDARYPGKYDNPLSLNHASVDGHGVSVGSRQAAYSPNSAGGTGIIIPRSGGDQYDPLFDSIEPSSNSFKKFDHIQKWEASNDSNLMLRLSGSNKPLDMEENNKKKEVGGIALATSLDNEEFGETADAEVGDVENGSQNDPNSIANVNMGEIEIDQIKSPGKSKKSKESRSMKHFKVALADFVKEVLKPSWRQGNMSKEAFKTVVKKTVDKVSGAVKGHQIPKSKAKINQYIDSSQRKLTKLVMGYVDKYAKG